MLSRHGPKATEATSYKIKPKLWNKINIIFCRSLFIPVIGYCFRRLTLLSNQYILHKQHKLNLKAWSCFPVWKMHEAMSCSIFGSESHNELKSSYKRKNLWVSIAYNYSLLRWPWKETCFLGSETVFWFLQDAIPHVNKHSHRPHPQIQNTNSLQNNVFIGHVNVSGGSLTIRMINIHKRL